MIQSTYNPKEDSRRWWVSVSVTLLLLGAIWGVFYYNITEYAFNLNNYGLRPRDPEGLIGIFTMVFLHGDWEHLINNSASLIVLSWALFYFYPKLAPRVMLYIVLFGGIWLWLFAREGTNHIGASGLVYGLGAFLFASGMIRRKRELMALSIMILFLHGGMIWGIFPQPEALRISWEGHLFGALAGVGLALHYRKRGPQRPKYQWEIDEFIEAKLKAQFNDVTIDQLEQRWNDRKQREMMEAQVAQQQQPHHYSGTSNPNIRYIYIKGPEGDSNSSTEED